MPKHCGLAPAKHSDSRKLSAVYHCHEFLNFATLGLSHSEAPLQLKGAVDAGLFQAQATSLFRVLCKDLQDITLSHPCASTFGNVDGRYGIVDIALANSPKLAPVQSIQKDTVKHFPSRVQGRPRRLSGNHYSSGVKG